MVSPFLLFQAEMSFIRKSNRRPGVNDTAKIRQFFNAYDANHDGVISQTELHQMLKKIAVDMSDEDIQKFFDRIDVDQSGEIEFGEFLDWYTTFIDMCENAARETLRRLEKTTSFTRNELETIYDNYKNVSASLVDDGTIDREEFRAMMMAGGVSKWNTFLVDGLFRMFDMDGSGTITFEEFVNILAIYHNKNKATIEEKHKLLFSLYDVDKDGKVSKTDLAKILNDCLCCNNMSLSDGDVMRIVEKTFERNGCKDYMTLQDYIREAQTRNLM